MELHDAHGVKMKYHEANIFGYKVYITFAYIPRNVGMNDMTGRISKH